MNIWKGCTKKKKRRKERQSGSVLGLYCRRQWNSIAEYTQAELRYEYSRSTLVIQVTRQTLKNTKTVLAVMTLQAIMPRRSGRASRPTRFDKNDSTTLPWPYVCSATTTANMATFHCFPKLPPELRGLIWAHSVEFRTVDSRALRADKRPTRKRRARLRDPYTPLPVPVVMQVCRESRSQQLYERVEYRYPPERPPVTDTRPGVTVDADPRPSEVRYAWVNFDKDMIDIETDDLGTILHLWSRIRRLKLERDFSSSSWYHGEVQDLAYFRNLEMCQIAGAVSVLRWFGGWEVHYLSCKRENVFFIDTNSGEMVNAVQLKEVGEASQKYELEEKLRVGQWQ